MIRRLMIEIHEDIRINVEDALAGDVVFYNSDLDDLVIRRKPNSWQKNETPIGIVVIPASHGVLKNGAGTVNHCGVMSLVNMSCNTPEDGTTSRMEIYWGNKTDIMDKSDGLDRYDSVNDGLTNYENVCICGSGTNISKEILSENITGELPTDNKALDYVSNPFDIGTYYFNNSTERIPSPYNNDGTFNEAYSQTTEPTSETNGMSDFKGIVNTKIITDLCSASWKTNKQISNSVSVTSYPAACCCARFKTLGTKSFSECTEYELKAGEKFWYLPSLGEIGYLGVRFHKIYGIIERLSKTYENIALFIRPV